MRDLRAGAAAAALLSVLTVVLGAPAATAATPDRVTDTGLVRGAYIVVLRDGSDVSDVIADHRRRLGIGRAQPYRHAVRGYAATMGADEAAAVRRDPRVRSITPDRLLEAAAQVTPTGRSRIASPPPDAAAATAAGVRVAVIDIGIEADHPDLAVAPGTDCSAPGTTYNPWHGTAVAGAIGARDDGEGVVGVAPGVALHDVRVTDFWTTQPGTQTTWSSVVCAVDWVTSTQLDDDPANDIDVVNMSLVGTNADDGACGRVSGDALHQAICASTAAGVLYVAAAGNGAEDFANTSPANYDEVLTVTGMADSDGRPGGLGPEPGCVIGELDDRVATFSNFATGTADRAHTIAAPAVCIRSTFVDGGYQTFGGTSLAAPHVAGVAALCIGSGRCDGTVPEMIATLRADAGAQSDADAGFGFHGDPLRPLVGCYVGPLVHAGIYTSEPAPPDVSPSLAGDVSTASCGSGGAPAPPPVAPADPTPPAVVEEATVVEDPAPPEIVEDTTSPALGAVLRRTQKLGTVLRKGLAVRLRTDEPADVELALLMSPKRAARLRLEPQVGVTAAGLTAAGAQKVKIEVSRAARRKLARLRQLKLTVSVRATDTAGNSTEGTTTTVTLQR
jgi:hypothetical protein